MGRKHDSLTLDMFEIPQPAGGYPGSMHYGAEVAHLVSDALRGHDRYQVAAKMSRLTGREVSKFMLDAWSAESRENHNMPFYLAPVLESALDTHIFSNWLADKRGGRLLVGREALNAELGKLEKLKDEAARKIRELKKIMGEME